MLNYVNTFIQVAPDCPTKKAIVPTSVRMQKSIPQTEYELLAKRPYSLSQEKLPKAIALMVSRRNLTIHPKVPLTLRATTFWPAQAAASRQSADVGEAAVRLPP